ncbi:MAG: mscM [Gammaproteobacteria bacterium]|jgi:potassium efflux system protein|nr:mscM [Gammaproteobacteria bacterium]
MQKRFFSCFNFNNLFFCIVFLYCFTKAFGANALERVDSQDNLKIKVIAQQIELSKSRYAQAEIELAHLQSQQNKQRMTLSTEHVNKQWLDEIKIDVDAAKSNLNGISLELSELQQTVNSIEKEIQSLNEQINAYDVLGVKMAQDRGLGLSRLHSQLTYQKTILKLEKSHADYLQKLQVIAEKNLQLYEMSYAYIESLLKSRTMMEFKERQEKSEIDYQHQQSVWLKQLAELYAKLAKTDHSQSGDKRAYAQLQSQIFYANENANFIYLQRLIASYQDQIQQLKVSMSRSTSLTFLNKVNEQAQALNKKLALMHNLLSDRIMILEKRKEFQSKNAFIGPSHVVYLSGLESQYKASRENVDQLNQKLNTLHASLDQAIKHELSTRQGFIGFDAKTWQDLYAQILLVPTLTFQVVKNLAQSIVNALNKISWLGWAFLCFLEIAWISLFYLLNRLCRGLLTIPDHALGHISLKWLSIQLLHRHLLDIAVLGNFFWFFYFCHIPFESFNFIIYLGLVGLFFKMAIVSARLCLVETVQDRAGHDVRLYYRLKWTLLMGAVVTAATVFLYQWPLLEVQNFFYRLFLLFLVIVSVFLLRARDLFLGLILHHIDEQRTYFRRIVRLLAVLVPLVLLVNSAIGFFGFINFVLSVYWYEGIFLIVLAAYLLIKGLLGDMMEYLSHLLIRHVSNGWLWTEAFLKPLDNILRIVLFLLAWVVLFFLFGWDRQSLVVANLTQLIHWPLFEILNTRITPMSVLELVIIISLLYWTARWTREFVYRFLLSHTKDTGVRNSIAILSQYTMILAGILIGLRVLGIDLRALTVVAGAFAFGIGLGLRDLANNFACGFLLLFERPLRVGDMVSINGQEGDVMHLGGRAVTIRTWDHMELIVPNTEIFNKTFINWTAQDYIVRSVVEMKVNRLDDPHEVQALISQTLADHKDVLKDPEPEVFLKELAGDLIEFEVRYYINLRQVRSRVSARSSVLMAIWDVFKQHGVQPPYPHHEVHFQ